MKRSSSQPSLRSFIKVMGMIMLIASAFSLPASAQMAGDPLETLPALHSLYSTTTTTEQKDQTPVPFRQEDQVPPAPQGSTFLDTFQSNVSNNIRQSAMWLDSFFYDPRYTEEKNATRAVVRNQVFLEEHAHASFQSKMQFVLILPQLQNKAHLIIAGDPNEDNPSPLAQSLQTSSAPVPNTNRNATAAIGYQVKSGERRNINIKIGIRRRHDGSFALFIRPYYRRLYHMDGWDLRFTQEFPFWTDIKWSSSTTVDVERPLGKTFFFRTSLNGSWYEHQPGYYYGLLFSLSQPLSTTSALVYELGSTFQTGSHDMLTAVAVNTRYRQRVWRDWMYFDITPQVRFPRDQRFKPVPGILFALEVQFEQGKGRL